MFFLVWFTYKDPFPLYKSSQRKNHLKSREFWDTFLLSALKMSITSVTSYQAGKKILKKRSLTPLAAVYSSFKVQMCSYVIVGNKIFCYFKKRVFPCLEAGTFEGQLKNFWWGPRKKRDEFNISGWRCYPGGGCIRN